MPKPDYRGARGSNAGDDFHELWALCQALALLDQDGDLKAVAVEGLRAEDERGTPQDTWDGVDCTYYFGGYDAASAHRIVVDQLKYSAADPDQPWTIARLSLSSNKSKDNAVMARLASAFAGLHKLRPDLADGGGLIVRLVSNQPIDNSVLHALTNQSPSSQMMKTPKTRGRPQTGDRTTLETAAGLKGEEFAQFARALDFSECGGDSRFRIEERALSVVSSWTDEDARTTVNNLLAFVRRAMLPEGKGHLVTRESILAWLGFDDPHGLFPCESALKHEPRRISRQVARDVVDQLVGGFQQLCLHGEGGNGKTTVLSEVEGLLPHGSVMLVFDCYGGGRYLDSDGYRHRPQDAFLHLSNDLARRVRVPLLLSRSPSLDYPRAFKKRLERAADVVASRGKDALLVAVVDAADNSVTAAATHSPPEPSFVHEFVRLGALPQNVRLIVTARTGRLDGLRLPPEYHLIKIEGFSRTETAAHVQEFWPDASETWLDDFHALSGGNPRVQRYSLDYSAPHPERALEYLRPRGKSLNQVFIEQLRQAYSKIGTDEDIRVFCAGLVAMPRPIPLSELAVVTGLGEAHVRDLCADFAPGVRLVAERISFADEDFEHFLRSEAKDLLASLRKKIADRFHVQRTTSAYAAFHLAAALFEAGRERDIIDLVASEPVPLAILDPILRREAQLQRLRIVMKVCREAGNVVDALLTLLTGAEAMKTDATIRKMLIDNPDLGACFAQDTSRRSVLSDSGQVENHGPLLFHLMAADSRKQDALSVREGARQVQAWLQRRSQDIQDQKRRHPNSQPHPWPVSDRDVAAETEAVLRTAGPQAAADSLRRWEPRSVGLRVAFMLARKLITAGEGSLVQRCLEEGCVESPWDLFLITPLILAGVETDVSRLELSLAELSRRGGIRPIKLREDWRGDSWTAEYLETILTACEIVAARGGDRNLVCSVLTQMSDPELRRQDRINTTQTTSIDLTLRAHALLERMAGRDADLQSYLIVPLDTDNEDSTTEAAQKKKAADDKREELRQFLDPIFDLYTSRSRALLGAVTMPEAESSIRKAIDRYHNQEFWLSGMLGAREMRMRAAQSLTRLLVMDGLESSVVLEVATSLFGSSQSPLDTAELRTLSELSLDSSLHPEIFRRLVQRSAGLRGVKASADEKLATMVSIVRVLQPISSEDARSLFNQAIDVASETDEQAIHEISLFRPLLGKAVSGMAGSERRILARNLAIFVGDAAVRLNGHDHFPWGDVAGSLGALDVGIALAAAARWEDTGVASRADLLPEMLRAALFYGGMTSTQACSLLSMLDSAEPRLIGSVATRSRAEPNRQGTELAETLARDELLRFGRGRRVEVLEEICSLAPGSPGGYWVNALQEATVFCCSKSPDPGLQERSRQVRQRHEKGFWSVLTPDWPAQRLTAGSGLDDFLAQVLAASRASGELVSVSEVLDEVMARIPIGYRRAYLEALTQSEYLRGRDYVLCEAISKCLEAWHDLPSVTEWCRESLLPFVVDVLPAFGRDLPYGRSPLAGVLARTGAPDSSIWSTILEGLERHVDQFDAPTICAMVGFAGGYCSASDATKVAMRYSHQLVCRIPESDRDTWDLEDIPSGSSAAIARFLFAMMGDVDLRLRWRAVHSLRRLARLGDTAVLDHLVEIYHRLEERSYRCPDAPFYWLAARLWMMVGMDRIANESPYAARKYGSWLVQVASDVALPHVVIRAFAKSSVDKLISHGAVQLTPLELEALMSVNVSPYSSQNQPKPPRRRFSTPPQEPASKRRFHFDQMDTVPYWYTPAVRIFADLDLEQFMDCAEHWIMERWKAEGDIWRWDRQPRRHRFSDQPMLCEHRHGARPTLERFSTYLEWHAMCCAIGELMQTEPLVSVGDDYGESLESWLCEEGLSNPPVWLADFHGPRPLERRMWDTPDNIQAWVDTADDSDLLAELGLSIQEDWVVVAASHDTQSGYFSASVRMRSALVQPETASSLVRALQTAEDPFDYRIPTAGNDFEIHSPPYRLVGWLSDESYESGIDEKDPLGYGARAVPTCPSVATVRALGLTRVNAFPVTWTRNNGGDTAFVYDWWGDGDEGDPFGRFDWGVVTSEGWRLRVHKESLAAFLSKKGLELVVKVELRRRGKSNDHSTYGEEEERKAGYYWVVLLRRDGTVEVADGGLGTWTSPRK